MTEAAKKILITGGTGFIGQALCARLTAAGYGLYILTRHKNRHRDTKNQSIIHIRHLDDLGAMDVDMVINLAGETTAQRWTESAKARIDSSRILTTRSLVQFMESRQKRPVLFISGSAVGYYGTDRETTFHENTPIPSIDGGFSKTLCQRWEAEAVKAKHLGVRTVCLRIGPVLEKGGGMMAKILPSFYLGLGHRMGDGNQWLSWIDRDDLVNLILFIIHHEEIEGPVNATAPNPVTNGVFAMTLARVLHKPCFLKMPGFVLKRIFGPMADEMMLNGQKVFPQKALDHGFDFAYPTLDDAFKKIFRA